MNDFNLLLRSIITNPDEDSVRLAMADWYEEHGQPERAEFIRVQCEIAQSPLSGMHPAGLEHGEIDPQDPTDPQQVEAAKSCVQEMRRVAKLRRREQKLFAANAAKWRFRESYEHGGEHLWACFLDPVPEDAASSHTVYKRGFVNSLSCTAEEFLKHADELIWHPNKRDCDHEGVFYTPCPDTAQPIRKVKLTTSPSSTYRMDQLAAKHKYDWLPTNTPDQATTRQFALEILTAEFPGIEFDLPPRPGVDTFIPMEPGQADEVIRRLREGEILRSPRRLIQSTPRIRPGDGS